MSRIDPMEPFGVLAVLKMGNENAYHLLLPVSRCRTVGTLRVVRPSPPFTKGPLEGSKYIQVRGRNTITRMMKMFTETVKLAGDPDVRVLISFNPVPYGVIALAAGALRRKPVHLGFVGSDWYRHCRSWYGPLLNLFLRRADLFTVTGEKMKSEMIARRYPGEKIRHLPHVVELDRFTNIPTRDREYDCIFVGAFIPRKRLDLILQSLWKVKEKIPNVRACLVGDGPLMPEMKDKCSELGLTDNVDFPGYVSDPDNLYSNSRILLIASDMEGFPYAMVEGMAAGAVPVSTDVGTISDFIRDGQNGILVPPNEADNMASAILSLLLDVDLYDRLKNQIVAERDIFSVPRAAVLWESWISGLISHQESS